MDGQRDTPQGFTLVELLVVLAILAVLAMMTAPGYQQLRQRVAIRQQALQLHADILFTRSEAIKRNLPVRMCPSTLAHGGPATCEGDFSAGWLVFADTDDSRGIDPGEPLLRLGTGLDAGYRLTNRAGDRLVTEMISYWPDGHSGRNRTLMVCSRALPALPSWSVVSNVFGRPRLAYGWGRCPE